MRIIIFCDNLGEETWLIFTQWLIFCNTILCLLSSLKKNVKESRIYNNSHLTDRNLIYYGLSKEKAKNSFKNTETEKKDEKYPSNDNLILGFSPINKIHTNQSVRTTNILSLKETTRINVTGKHSHAKSEIDYNSRI